MDQLKVQLHNEGLPVYGVGNRQHTYSPDNSVLVYEKGHCIHSPDNEI